MVVQSDYHDDLSIWETSVIDLVALVKTRDRFVGSLYDTNKAQAIGIKLEFQVHKRACKVFKFILVTLG